MRKESLGGYSEAQSIPQESIKQEGLLTKGSELDFLKGISESKDIAFDSHRSSLETIDGKLLAIPVVLKMADGEKQDNWITAQFDVDKIEYVLSANDSVVDSRSYTAQESFEVSELLDKKVKKVTGRSMGSYPNEFLLSYSEVWPKDADMAVIGDPYQRIDRDRTTLIDYEYADEIMPDNRNLIEQVNSGEMSLKDVQEELNYFYKNLHIGDEVSLAMIHGGLTPETGNPYVSFVDDCIDLASKYIYSAGKNISLDSLEKETIRLQKRYTELRLGTWEYKEYKPYFEDDDEALKKLEIFYKIKEGSVHPSPKAWDEYITSWDQLLDRIPDEVINDSNLGETKERVEHWLKEIPKIKGVAPTRIQDALRELSKAYKEIIDRVSSHPKMSEVVAQREGEDSFGFSPVGEEYVPPQRKSEDIDRGDVIAFLNDYTILDAGKKGMMSDSPFGIATPGIPVNYRADGYLSESVDFIRRTETYLKNIYPILKKEKERIEEIGIPLNEKTMNIYLDEIEQTFIREQLHKQRAHRSEVVHGYFPHDFKGKPNSKDQIVGLWSLSTHVWGSYDNPVDFKNDIEKSIEFLRPEGKLILGPINYKSYSIWKREGEVPENFENSFDSISLKQACEDLYKEGKIDYEFVKVLEDYEVEVTKNFGEGDVAGSLIITKAKE